MRNRTTGRNTSIGYINEVNEYRHTGTLLVSQKCQVRAFIEDSSNFGSLCTVSKVKKGQVQDRRARFIVEIHIQAFMSKFNLVPLVLHKEGGQETAAQRHG